MLSNMKVETTHWLLNGILSGWIIMIVLGMSASNNVEAKVEEDLKSIKQNHT